MDLPSRLDLRAIGRDYFVQRAKKLDPGQVDVEGSNADLFVGSTSVMGAAVVRQLGYNVSRLTLDGCEDEDVDRYAYDRYGSDLPRKGASPAVGPVRIYRTSALAGGGSVLPGTPVGTLSGVSYVTTSTASFGGSDLSSTANVRAVQSGKSTQVGANLVRKFTQPGKLFDQTLQINNDVATAGGEDREDDDTYKSRIRSYWRTARRGTVGAVAAGALTVPGVVSAMAQEAFGFGGLPARLINLFISDSSGVANSVLAQLVNTVLLDYRGGGIAVLVYPGIPEIVGVQLALAYVAGTDTVTLQGLIQSAVVEYVNSLPVGVPLTIGGIYAVLIRFVADGLVQPTQQSIVSPVGDLIPAIGQSLKTTPANVTFA